MLLRAQAALALAQLRRGQWSREHHEALREQLESVVARVVEESERAAARSDDKTTVLFLGKKV
jgi:hypothetical protein